MSADLARDLAHCEAQILRCEEELRIGTTDIDGAGLGLHDWAREREIILREMGEDEGRK